MKFITKQELDTLLTQLIDVLFVEERSFESIIGEFENDDELVQKVKVILFFSPIYYPKNVMISKMMHRNKFLCRIKIENIWREEMIQKRDNQIKKLLEKV
jgi:arginine utilization protein RocB